MSLTLNKWMHAHFTGVGDPFTQPAIGSPCDTCKGLGKLPIGDLWTQKFRPCYGCDATGWYLRQFVKVNVALAHGQTAQETVSPQIFAGGPTPNGMRPPSRLYILLRTIAGLPVFGEHVATANEVKAWLATVRLPVPILVLLEQQRGAYRLCIKHPVREVIT